nr:MAG TPA: hypothetical protein [Caudoviricetes sp.]
MGLLNYIAWPECDRLYLEKKYFEIHRIIVPQDLIINPVNKIALPVYLTMYIMDNSTVNDCYNLPVTLKNICDRIRIYKNIQLREVHYTAVADAIQWLIDREYIVVDKFDRKSTAKFFYKFTDDLKNAIKKGANGKKQQFLYVSIKEINKLFSAIYSNNKNWKFSTDALIVYMYLKLKETSWQYIQRRKPLPVWVGYLGNMYDVLNISSRKVSLIITWLKSEKIILPIYGAKEKSSGNRAKTIIVFLLCCNECDIHKIVASAEAQIKEKDKNACWYPVDIAEANVDALDEAALDVVCDEDEVY